MKPIWREMNLTWEEFSNLSLDPKFHIPTEQLRSYSALEIAEYIIDNYGGDVLEYRKDAGTLEPKKNYLIDSFDFAKIDVKGGIKIRPISNEKYWVTDGNNRVMLGTLLVLQKKIKFPSEVRVMCNMAVRQA